jgi:dTDP-4-amino-4,6-dideoxygalactose transaminase
MAIHEEKAYAGASSRLVHTAAAARDLIMLPLFADLTYEQQDYVLDRVAKHMEARAA